MNYTYIKAYRYNNGSYTLNKIEGFEIMKIISIKNNNFILEINKKENGMK